MRKEKIQFKDSQVKKNLKWLILRLLRIKNSSEKDLLEKLNNVYVGYWIPNQEVLNKILISLVNEEQIIKYSNDQYRLTKKGLKVLLDREDRIKQFREKSLSKESCAAYSLWGNIGLSLLEFGIGFLSGSIGLFADAIHTAVDIIASLMTWIGIKLAKEAQAALAGGIILFGIGAFIAFESIMKISQPVDIQFQAIALMTIAVNIVINGFFSFYKFYVGGKTRSISLVADAYHTKTDIWSSIAVLIGLLGATTGFPMMDAVAGVVVSVFIFIGGYELISESKEVLQGKDPNLEKFSKFLKTHLQVLPKRGTFVSLWLLSIQEMNQEENLRRIKEALGARFPVGLKDSDYEGIFEKLHQENLVTMSGEKLKISEKGRERLKVLAEEPVASRFGTRRNFISAKRIQSFSEGL